MSKRIVGATCAAALLSFTVVAAEQVAPQSPTQSPVQGGTPGASQQQPARPAPTAGQITVTGCVTREVAGQFALSNASSSPAGATASRAEPAGAIAGSTESGREGATSGAVGTSGRAGAGASATAGEASAGAEAAGSSRAEGSRAGASITAANNMTYSLAGDRENDLEKYVGQRVEIVGTVGAGDSTSSAGAGSTSAAGSKSGDAASAPVARPEGSTQSGDAARTDSDRGDSNRASASAQAPAHAQRLNIVSVRPVGGQCD